MLPTKTVTVGALGSRPGMGGLCLGGNGCLGLKALKLKMVRLAKIDVKFLVMLTLKSLAPVVYEVAQGPQEA